LLFNNAYDLITLIILSIFLFKTPVSYSSLCIYHGIRITSAVASINQHAHRQRDIPFFNNQTQTFTTSLRRPQGIFGVAFKAPLASAPLPRRGCSIELFLQRNVFAIHFGCIRKRWCRQEPSEDSQYRFVSPASQSKLQTINSIGRQLYVANSAGFSRSRQVDHWYNKEEIQT
jgi:hypothetical protein